MTTTPIAGTTHLTSNAANAEVPVNTMVDTTERMSNSTKEWTVAADFTCTQVEFSEGFMHELNGTPAAAFAFGVYPVARFFGVKNASGQICTVYVQGQSGTGVSVADVSTATLYSDGVNITGVGTGSGGVGGGSGAFSGCRVKKAADQTAANYTVGNIVAWDAEVFDIGGWHDNVTNNSRLTVPTSGYVEFTGCVQFSSGTADRSVFLILYKNGVELLRLMGNDEMGQIDGAIATSSGPLAVIAGDYFELLFSYEADTSITVEEESSFFAAKYLGS